MEIKILGTGCNKCKKLEQDLKMIVDELNIDARIEKVEKLVEIVKYGVVTTPGLVIDDKVVSAGKALSTEQLKKLLMENSK